MQPPAAAAQTPEGQQRAARVCKFALFLLGNQAEDNLEKDPGDSLLCGLTLKVESTFHHITGAGAHVVKVFVPENWLFEGTLESSAHGACPAPGRASEQLQGRFLREAWLSNAHVSASERLSDSAVPCRKVCPVK